MEDRLMTNGHQRGALLYPSDDALCVSLCERIRTMLPEGWAPRCAGYDDLGGFDVRFEFDVDVRLGENPPRRAKAVVCVARHALKALSGEDAFQQVMARQVIRDLGRLVACSSVRKVQVEGVGELRSRDRRRLRRAVARADAAGSELAAAKNAAAIADNQVRALSREVDELRAYLAALVVVARTIVERYDAALESRGGWREVQVDDGDAEKLRAALGGAP